MAQALNTLPLGAKLEIQVAPDWQHKFGIRIVFIVVDKNHSGYPSGAVSLMTEKALMTAAYDAKEPTNPNTNRASGGNSRYIYSNIHKWLNSSASSAWYSAKHTYDAPPIAANVVNGKNPYADWPGFLAILNEQFGITLMSTSLQASRPDVDGGGLDNFSAKMFLPSIREMGYAPYATTADGTILSYFNTNERRAYPIPETGEYGFVDTYTRSARSEEYAWALDKRKIYEAEFSNMWAYGFAFIRPMCNLPGSTMVMPSPVTSGQYQLVENPPNAPTINQPGASKTIYNARPRMLVTISKASAALLSQAITSSDWTPSRATAREGDKVLFRKAADAAPGSVAFSVQTKTQYSGLSTAAQRSTTYQAPTYTDSPIQPGSSRIKAVHMTELREMINKVRRYYGLGVNLMKNTDTSINQTAHWTKWGNITISVWNDFLRFTTLEKSGCGIVSPEFFLNANAGDNFVLSFIAAYNNEPIKLDYCHLIDSVSGNVSLTSLGADTPIIDGSTMGNRHKLKITLNKNYNHPIKVLIGTRSAPAANLGVVVGYPKFERGWAGTAWGEENVEKDILWEEEIIKDTTSIRGWKGHIEEMRMAINDIVAYVNNWDKSTSANRIPAPVWISIKPGRPQADVMEQIRSVIALL